METLELLLIATNSEWLESEKQDNKLVGNFVRNNRSRFVGIVCGLEPSL